MLWKPEDDEVLRIAKSSNELNFKLILRYKGKINLQKRLNYINV
jgi:hypothetical protein